MIRIIPLSLALAFLVGCMTTAPNAEFVRSVTFSSLQTFSYKHTLITGLDFRDSEEMMIEALTDQVLSEEFQARGFSEVDMNSDFYIVTKWKKSVSSYPSHFHSIDGVAASLNQRDNPSYRFASRLHLTVEVYETSTRNLFWRKDLPNIFDAIELTEDRLSDSLRRAVANFPQRVEKDPNLPDIE